MRGYEVEIFYFFEVKLEKILDNFQFAELPCIFAGF
jgi:hypothetical protein